MICHTLMIAGAMASPEALYYAETCYTRSLSLPVVTRACVETFPERSAEFDSAETAWRKKYAVMFERSRAYLVSRRYDFEDGTASRLVRVAESWSKADQAKGRTHMRERCDDHLAELRS